VGIGDVDSLDFLLSGDVFSSKADESGSSGVQMTGSLAFLSQRNMHTYWEGNSLFFYWIEK
jgi:hypothetical protein